MSIRSLSPASFQLLRSRPVDRASLTEFISKSGVAKAEAAQMAEQIFVASGHSKSDVIPSTDLERAEAFLRGALQGQSEDAVIGARVSAEAQVDAKRRLSQVMQELAALVDQRPTFRSDERGRRCEGEVDSKEIPPVYTQVAELGVNGELASLDFDDFVRGVSLHAVVSDQANDRSVTFNLFYRDRDGENVSVRFSPGRRALWSAPEWLGFEQRPISLEEAKEALLSYRRTDTRPEFATAALEKLIEVASLTLEGQPEQQEVMKVLQKMVS